MADDRDERDSARTYVVSFESVDRGWADWIEHWLGAAGQKARLQRLELSPATSATQTLEDLLAPGLPVILVLSPWYFRRGRRPLDEWNQALRGLARRQREQLIALVVADDGLPDAVSVLAPQRLIDIPEAAALRRMHHTLGLPGAAPSPRDPAGTEEGRPRYPGAPAAVWGGVRGRNPLFTGRHLILDRLHADTAPDHRDTRAWALVGMPGVGKSELAAEYAHRYHNSYELIWWVPSDERGKARASLAALAGRLRLETGGEIGDQIRAVQEALRVGRPHRDWLLIFDNAEDPELIAPLLPSGTGRVILTSANTTWQDYGIPLLEVEPYSENESVAFAARRAPRFNTDEARELAEALGRLPLALDQGLAWLRDSDMSAQDYIRLLAADHEASARDLPAHQGTLQRVMDIRLSQLRDTNPTAVQVLRLCACFSEGRLPTRLVRPTVAKDLPEGLGDVVAEPVRWTEALADLKSRSLLRLEYTEPGLEQGVGGRGSTIELHRMIRHAVLAGMSRTEHAGMVRAARQILAAADPGAPEDTSTWPRYAEITPHILATEALRSANPVVQELVVNSIRYLYLRGEYRSGLSLAEQAQAEWSEGMDPRPARYWELRVQHGHLVRALADYAQAERIDQESVAELRREGTARELEYLRALVGLGADLRALARYDEALEISEAVRDRYGELLGAEHPESLRARHNLGITLQLLGRYEEALTLHRDATALAERVMGTAHPHTLIGAMATAQDLRLLGTYDEALERQEHALEWCEEGLGLQHPVTLRAQHLLGRCLRRTGATADAAQALRRAAARHRQLLGEDHPDALAVQADLGCLLREQGDLDQAAEIARVVSAGFRRSYGTAHPYTVGADCNRAMVLWALGEREPALELVDSAVVRMENALGPDHPWSIGTLINSSACRNHAGDVDVARRQSRIALTRSTETLGPDHPMTLTCTVALAADLRATGDRLQAAKLEQHAVARLAETLGPQHIHTRAATSRERPFWDIEFLGA